MSLPKTVSVKSGWTVGPGWKIGAPPPPPVDLYTPLAGSLSFNGTSQYLGIDPGVTPAAGAFTIEGWFYNNSVSDPFVNKGLIGTDQSVGLSLFPTYYDTITLDRNGGGYQLTYTWSSPVLQTNKWQYIVLNRNASTDLETMWVGTFVDNYSTVTCARATGAAGGGSPSGGTQTDSQAWGNSNWVGRFYGGYFPGYITNFRVTIGAAVYDSNNSTITAPVAPLTSGANTEYLMLGAVVTTDTSGTQTVTNNGTITQTATKPF
jgi:hypothetical protein